MGLLPPLSPREDGPPFTHPNQEVLETSAPPKDLQCPGSLFFLSPSSQKTFLLFLSGFTASLHCSSLAIPHIFCLHLLSARTQRPPGLCNLCSLGTHRLGKPQNEICLKWPELSSKTLSCSGQSGCCPRRQLLDRLLKDAGWVQ